MSDTIAEITKELQSAIEKHWALFVTAYIVNDSRTSCEKHKDVVSVLEEECFEAIEAALQGDYSHARQEFAQVAAVTIRAMMMCMAKAESPKGNKQ